MIHKHNKRKYTLKNGALINCLHNKSTMRRYLPAVIFFIIAGIVGLQLLRFGHAATLTAASEVENGTIAGTASQLSDATASGGKAVKFGSATGGTGFSVNCPLTHAAGADGINSCWATHTGVQGATGYTEAQIKANPGALGFTKINNSMTITQSGTTIDHEWINGCIAIVSAATNITIKNSLITDPGDTSCRGGDTIAAGSALNNGNVSGANGVLVEDTTVDGENFTTDTGNGISLHDARLLRVNSFGFGKNFVLSQNDTITDSYSHDANNSNSFEHDDPIMLDTSDHITMEHDYIIGTGGASPPGGIAEAWAIQADWGPSSYISIDSSYAEGVTNYDAFFSGCNAKGIDANHFTITNNAFSNDSGPYAEAANWNAADSTNVWGPGNYITDMASGANLGPYGPPGC